jgi:hypothetical protein
MPIDDQMTVTDQLVLDTWEAITLLGEAQELCETDDIAELLAKAEEILTSVVSELPVLARSAGAKGRGNDLTPLGERAAGVTSAQTPFDHRREAPGKS